MKKIVFFGISLILAFLFFTFAGSCLAADITVTSGPEMYQKVTIGQQVNLAWTKESVGDVKIEVLTVDLTTYKESVVYFFISTNNNAGIVMNYPLGIYGFRVSLVEDSSVFDYSNGFFLYDPNDVTPPPAPINQKVTASNYYPDRLSFEFTIPTVSDFYNINIYRSSVLGQLGTIVASSSPYLEFTSYTESNPTGTYYYTLRSVDIKGNESANINQIIYDWSAASIILITPNGGEEWTI